MPAICSGTRLSLCKYILSSCWQKKRTKQFNAHPYEVQQWHLFNFGLRSVFKISLKLSFKYFFYFSFFCFNGYVWWYFSYIQYILLPQIPTRAPNADSSTAENTPQQMPPFLFNGTMYLWAVSKDLYLQEEPMGLELRATEWASQRVKDKYRVPKHLRTLFLWYISSFLAP